jgi:hypothetical protein
MVGVGWSAEPTLENRGGARSPELSVSKGGARNKHWELGWGDKPTSQSRGHGGSLS